MKKKAKIDIWENGCGANIGKHVIHFTGIQSTNNPSYEGIYVTLKYPVWHCPSLIYIPNRRHNHLRNAIDLAKMLQNKGLLAKPSARKF